MCVRRDTAMEGEGVIVGVCSSRSATMPSAEDMTSAHAEMMLACVCACVCACV
ncbi:MAG: hypothetical protein P4L40_01720 [Terracidiphilus sp.]|nr:hypothetical protein [Terracidiphilus sp.]